MADIRVNSTGRLFRRIDDGVAQLLMEAMPEVFSRIAEPKPRFNVDPTPPKYETPYYCVGRNDMGLFAIVRKHFDNVRYITIADPARLKQLYPDCPEGVVEQWKKTPVLERA